MSKTKSVKKTLLVVKYKIRIVEFCKKESEISYC